MTSDTLPEYQSRLEAFHRAFAAELRAIVRSVPMSPRMRVLDVGCGDGFYTRLLAERLQSPGSVTGLDSSGAFLDLARQSLADCEGFGDIEFLQSKLEEVSPGDELWDLVWCAQSLYSLPEPVTALAQMMKLVRPGGFVVVLENDTLHQLLLPWPMEVEIALRTAELKSFAEESTQPSKFYIGRRLPAAFAAAGLEPLHFRTQCIDRHAPLETPVREFLEMYLIDLMERTKDHLSPQRAESLSDLIDPKGDRGLLSQPHFTMSWLNVLAWGRRP